jgi:hypothetical protein
MTFDPIRLLEQHDVSDTERSLLEAAQTGAAVEYDVVAGAARFRANLAGLAASGAAVGTVKGTTAVGAKALMAKLAFKVLIGLAASTTMVGAGIVIGMRLGDRPDPSHAPPSTGVVGGRSAVANVATGPATALIVAAPASPEIAPSVVPASADREVTRASSTPSTHMAVAASTNKARSAGRLASTTESDSDGLATTRSSGAPAPARPAVVASVGASETTSRLEPAALPETAEPSRTEGSDSLGELRLIAVARNLIERDPDAALSALDRIRRSYPNGYFVEERQALTVIALARSNQTPAARQQAASFLRTYPNGPFSDRIRAIRDL